jgi:hypothetical protein
VPDAISDTGPVLHLQEVGRLTALIVVAPLLLPDLVIKELEARGLGTARLREAGIDFVVKTVEPLAWRTVLRDIAPQIQPADAQVFSLAQVSGFQSLVLTDDLALRRLLESHGGAGGGEPQENAGGGKWASPGGRRHRRAARKQAARQSPQTSSHLAIRAAETRVWL